MKKIIAVLAIIATTIFASGCSTSVVPPGYVGKKVSTSGVQPEIAEPGRHFYGFFTRMILINTSSELVPAKVNVIMADYGTNRETGESERRIGLSMDFIVNIRYRIRDNDDVINAMLRDMTLDSGTNVINAEQMYRKYGNMVIGRVTREVLGQYTPEEVLHNLEQINAAIHAGVSEGLEGSPIHVSSVSLGPITLPKVITERINSNKDTELSEAQARAQQQIDLLQKQNEIELARQQAVRERIDAQSLAEQNKILNSSITSEVLRLRELQIREKEIEMMRSFGTKGNSTVFIPYGAVDNTGAQMRMFSK